MDAEYLVELMEGYLMQYGIINSFLDYCENDLGLDKDEVEETIDKIIYGYKFN